MSWPALIPALALLAGVVCGCVLLSGAPTAPLVVMLAAAFASSAAGFATRRDRIFLAGNVLTFVLAGWLLGVDASREALRPPLLALLESGAMGTAGHIPADGEPVGPVVIEGQLREDAA
ncbi:MAG: hypothetical protein IMZ44_06040, partial [Planctomycetes bacterium]|nr:hypothetical protein [Planctomycetota bacterium]